MRESKKLTRGVFWSFLAIIFNAMVALLISILLGRLLGPSELGLYRLARTIAYFVTVIFGLGVPTAATKYIAEHQQDPENQKQIMSSAILLSFVIGIFLMTVSYMMSPSLAVLFGSSKLQNYLQAISPYIFLLLVNGVLQSFLLGRRDIKHFGISVIIENGFMLVLSLLLVLSGQGAQGALVALDLAALINCTFLTWKTGILKVLTLKNVWSRMKQMVIFGLQVLLSTLANQVNYRADILVLGYFADEEIVGYYSVSVTLGNFLFLMPSAIQRVTYPATVQYWKDQRYDLLTLLLERGVRYTTSVMLVFVMGIIFFAKEVVFLLYGNTFAPSVFALQILAIGILVNAGFSRAIGGTLAAIDRLDVNLIITGVAAGVNVLLLVLLVPVFGLNGAAFATGFGFALRGILGLYFNFHLTRVKIPYAWLVKSLLYAILGYVSYWIFSLFVSGPAEIIIRLVVLILFTLFSWVFLLSAQDRKFILKLLGEEIKTLKKKIRKLSS